MPESDRSSVNYCGSYVSNGASLIEAIKDLLTHGTPSQMHIVAAIASKEGVEVIRKAYPEAHLWVGVVDAALTSKGYITPVRRCR